MNLATLHKTAPTRFLPQEHRPPRQVSFLATIHPHMKGQLILHLLWTQTLETLQLITFTLTFPLQRSSSSYRRNTSCSPSSHCSGLCHPPAVWCPHCHSCHNTPTDIISPNPNLTTSPIDFTHATLHQTKASLIPATLTTLFGKCSQWGKPSHTQDFPTPIHPTIPKLLSSMTPHQILPQIQTATLILKPLGPSPSSDEDE